MAKRSTKTKLGAAGAALLHRRTGATGAEALATATAPTSATRAPRPTLDGYKVTTIRFAEAQWAWLRRQALERSIRSGTQGDAGEIVREPVAAAMTKEPKAKGAAR
jgi:hypothetical protein